MEILISVLVFIGILAMAVIVLFLVTCKIQETICENCDFKEKCQKSREDGEPVACQEEFYYNSTIND